MRISKRDIMLMMEEILVNNDVLVLEWQGMYAHFRDLSSNSTSLTYPAPPRSTVIGMLGLLLGLKEDEYPYVFSTEVCNIAVEPMSENVTQIEKFNYINNDEKNSANVGVEYLREKSLDFVRYWIYVNHQDGKILDELEYLTKNSSSKCGAPGMGKRHLISYVDFVARTQIREKSKKGNVTINTITPMKYIKSMDFERDYEEGRRINKTKMQRELTVNKELKSVEKYIIPLNMKGIYVVEVNEKYNIIDVNGEEKRVYWM